MLTTIAATGSRNGKCLNMVRQTNRALSVKAQRLIYSNFRLMRIGLAVLPIKASPSVVQGYGKRCLGDLNQEIRLSIAVLIFQGENNPRGSLCPDHPAERVGMKHGGI